MLHVAVIGAGAAGAAAAWALARGGAQVTSFAWQSGATALYSGALDYEPWERSSDPEPLDPELMVFAAALGAWSVGASSCRVATASGVLRSARGVDAALLNLAPLAGARIAVADVPREDWDGALLANALAKSSWARKTRTEFVPVPLAILDSSVESRIPSYDFAALFDDPERAALLCRELVKARHERDAWLLGPWLGTTSEVSERVRQNVELGVGETTSGLGGPAGARFEQARERLFAASNIEARLGEVLQLEPRFSGWTVRFRSSPNQSVRDAETLEVDAVVLATGGVAAGGVRLVKTDRAEPTRESLGLSLEAPVVFQLDGHLFDGASSLHGIDFQARGAKAIERLGVAAEGVRALGQSGLFVAGDVIADRPRTVLEAARSGILVSKALLSPRRASAPPPPQWRDRS